MIPPDGIYRGIDYQTYAAWPAVRASTLNACAKTMAHGRLAEIEGSEETEAKKFGTIAHFHILEPATFHDRYIVAPACDRRYKEGKQIWAEFLETAGDRSIVTADEYGTATCMMASLMQNAGCRQIMDGAIAHELSVLWTDEETGLRCKARIDLLSRIGNVAVIADLKTTAEAGRRAFERSSTQYGYYRSMAWYQAGLAKAAPCEVPRRCVLIALEKTAPYLAKGYEFDDWALDTGLAEMRELLHAYAAARQSGDWPGYGDDIGTISLPEWKSR